MPQGKDTIWKIVKPLREMGIPAVGIYDIDIIKNEGSNWTNALKAGFVPDISPQSLGQHRSQIKKKFEETGKDMKKEGGVNILTGADNEACNNLFDELNRYGLFVVRHGEVEKWLKYLGVDSHKSVWLPHMFEKMGSDPKDENYVKPQEGDVWNFIHEIKKWMLDKNKKGIPA